MDGYDFGTSVRGRLFPRCIQIFYRDSSHVEIQPVAAQDETILEEALCFLRSARGSHRENFVSDTNLLSTSPVTFSDKQILSGFTVFGEFSCLAPCADARISCNTRGTFRESPRDARVP